jgi:hypothetical protein
MWTAEETSVHILCECETLASLRHSYLGSFFLDPEELQMGCHPVAVVIMHVHEYEIRI